MTVRLLLKTKGTFVPVIRSDLTLQDVVDQLQVDEARNLCRQPSFGVQKLGARYAPLGSKRVYDRVPAAHTSFLLQWPFRCLSSFWHICKANQPWWTRATRAG